MATKAQEKAFIEQIAPLIQKEAKARGYKVCSAIIAQACHESGYNTSLLSKKYHNYMGLKAGAYWKGKTVRLKTKEEYKKGVLTEIYDNFRVFDSMEDGVKGYFDFVSTKRYANLKTATSPEQYLNFIKADKYCTSSTYVERCMDKVRTHNLTQYDSSSNVSKPKSETNSKTNNPYPVPTKLLKNGSRGNEVRWLQFALNQHGYKLSVDGIFGAKTEQAVRDFQSRHKLICDGLVGQQTRTELQR